MADPSNENPYAKDGQRSTEDVKDYGGQLAGPTKKEAKKGKAGGAYTGWGKKRRKKALEDVFDF